MRTPEVEWTMKHALAGDSVAPWEDLRTLAAEVERLEKREKELEADLDAYAPPVLQDGRPILDSFGSKLRRDVRARAEAAEARVAELEAEALNGRHAVFTDLKAQLAAANEQNARLRALAFELASSLGACAGYIASVRTDRQITQDENVYALQTLEWAEGAVEVAQYANAALEAYDKALNGEEASK